ncbi:hypothetical protein QWZ14_17880, partial [Paeniroseomonas aquatica]|nr:hypothetical protein [Paeniroseomonas aquatica]
HGRGFQATNFSSLLDQSCSGHGRTRRSPRHVPYERRQDSQPQALGYKVRSKIYGCDIVSIGPGEPPLVVITELNLTLSPELICKASSGGKNPQVAHYH